MHITHAASSLGIYIISGVGVLAASAVVGYMVRFWLHNKA